ncbi:hypothetical protein HZH68_002099 [Vespula germanica]|uniref:Uncharacterized protein n=1 Tax=Vespula germanica TaxID=30212 RepID=A0A834NKM3_VESGE|nr:hypothetical protein HZH68_002099 [Vespula germanica]
MRSNEATKARWENNSYRGRESTVCPQKNANHKKEEKEKEEEKEGVGFVVVDDDDDDDDGDEDYDNDNDEDYDDDDDDDNDDDDDDDDVLTATRIIIRCCNELRRRVSLVDRPVWSEVVATQSTKTLCALTFGVSPDRQFSFTFKRNP